MPPGMLRTAGTLAGRAGRGQLAEGNAIWIQKYAKCVLLVGAVIRGFLLPFFAFFCL